MVVNNQNSNNALNMMHDIINPIFLIDFLFIFTLFYRFMYIVFFL